MPCSTYFAGDHDIGAGCTCWDDSKIGSSGSGVSAKGNGSMVYPTLEYDTLILFWFLGSYQNNLYLKVYTFSGVYSELGIWFRGSGEISQCRVLGFGFRDGFEVLRNMF